MRIELWGGGFCGRLLFASAASAIVMASTPVRAADDDPWIARDKAFHFDASAGIAATTYALASWKLVDARWESLAIGGGVTLAIGAAKEGVDGLGFGTPSWKDFTWDAIGAVVGLALAWTADVCLGGVNAAHPALGAPRAIAVQF